MFFQPSYDSFGINLLGFMCSWWHPRQANDSLAFELSIFSKNNSNIFLMCIAVNSLVHTYILGSAYVWWKKTMNRQTHAHTRTHTHTHTHTHGTTTVTLAVHVHQRLIVNMLPGRTAFGARCTTPVIFLGLCQMFWYGCQL